MARPVLGVLRPAIAEAAHRLGATEIGLVDLYCGDGLNLWADHAGVSYGDRFLGDPDAPLRVTCTIVGGRHVPTRELPTVVARIGLDSAPLLDATPPAAAAPALLLLGDPLRVLPEALDRVPGGALPVVTSTWALSRVRPARRPLVLEALERAGRPVAWVSVEGVGVAPSVPTLGDRPASGHSLVGIAVPGRPTDTVARCWSRGRMLTWLA